MIRRLTANDAAIGEVLSRYPLRSPKALSLHPRSNRNENFIVEGDKLWILDWEYAGMGDLFFDLGNVAVHHDFTDEQDAFLLESYFGTTPTAAALARQKLMKIMSDFREAMWGVAQMGLSKLDFDFKGYAEKHFNRLRQNASDARYTQWLKDAAT